MSWLAPVLTVVGLGMQMKSASEERKATKERIKAQKVEQRINDVRAQRERQMGRAQARVARAQQIAAAFGSGAQDSSALAGSLSAASADLASNIGFNSMIGGLSQQASIFNINAAQRSTNAATYGAYANLAKQGASIFNGPTFA